MKAHAAFGGIPVVLARADQLHVVIAPVQSFDHARDRHRHTVDFRRIGLGHEGDTQRAACGGVGVDNDALRRGGQHARMVPIARNSSMTLRSRYRHGFVTSISRDVVTIRTCKLGPRLLHRRPLEVCRDRFPAGTFDSALG
jgi:hypothetical protein